MTRHDTGLGRAKAMFCSLSVIIFTYMIDMYNYIIEVRYILESHVVECSMESFMHHNVTR